MTKTNKDQIDIAVINAKLDNLTCSIDDIKKKLEADYVTRAEFMPISRGFYGLISVVGVIIIGAVLAIIIKR